MGNALLVMEDSHIPETPLNVEGYNLYIIDGRPMIQDVELGERLQYTRPRKVKELIERLLDQGKINKNNVCTAVGQTSEQGGRPGATYYLDRHACMKVIFNAETKVADKITDEVIQVFLAYQDGTLKPKAKPTSTKATNAKDNAIIFRAMKSVAITAGLKGNQAVLAANRATIRMTGVDHLKMIDSIHLVAEKQVRHFTSTDLGERIGMSAKEFNLWLQKIGFQVAERDAKGRQLWKPTEKGMPYAVLLDWERIIQN
ncbi:MAG: hypothetical protein HQL84_18105 [Magnetococcales bacterium]|nr:hypothetical protein [Magnetococcales bacterium]